MMLDFSIGASALAAAQQALQAVGQNVANANTPGYHLQTVNLESSTPMVLDHQAFGSGVDVSSITRAYNQSIESALTSHNTASAYTTSLLSTMSQLQSSIPTDSSSISSLLGSVFNDLQQVSGQPNVTTGAQIVVNDASALAQQFNSISGSIRQMSSGLDQQINQTVDTVNPLLKQIAGLNGQIAAETNAGDHPNDLLDLRDQLVNQVAQQIPIQVQDAAQGEVTIVQSGVPVVVGNKAAQFKVMPENSAGQTNVQVVNSLLSNAAPTNLTITSGTLGGLLDAHNNQLPQYLSQLNSLAMQVAQSFDAIQTTGVGVAGGYSSINGQRGVTDPTAQLNTAGLTFPVTSGSLYIGLTNTATGARTMTQIQIDPTTQSLNDVATSIGTQIPNIQAFVNSATGTLSLIAAPNCRIDFTGGVNSSPTTSFSAGTTVTASAGGTYSGTTNDNYTYTFLSSGTVGVTPGLQAQITDQSGNKLGVINIGQGYSPGQPISGPNGVTLSLSSGNVVAGDSVSVSAIGQPDTAGILTALGLNTFFTGNDAASLAVSSQLTADPTLLATSQTRASGDTTNLQRFLSLQNQNLMGQGSQTLSENYTQMIASLGSQVSALNEQDSTNQVLTTQLQNQQQGISGVNINQQMLYLIQYQQMFESASQYVSTLNSMYQQMFQSL